jgi:hypothetical protein
VRQRGDDRAHGRDGGAYGRERRGADEPARTGSVALVEDRGRPWLELSFPFDEKLNDEVKRLPGRRFDWDARTWLVPAEPRLGSVILELFARHPWLKISDEVRDWIATFAGWTAVVTVTESRDGPAFAVAGIGGTPPPELQERGIERDDWMLLPMDAENARFLRGLEGAEFDEPARHAAQLLLAGREVPAATLELSPGPEGEAEFELHGLWGLSARSAFELLPEAHRARVRTGEFHVDEDAAVLAVPADAALALDVAAFLEGRPDVSVSDEARELLDRLVTEHRERERTVELSHAEDADIGVTELGGELRPFQRAGVAYALRQRRTFIADEQGLGKTVQALAALEVDDAYPAVVVCPASIKLNWEREAHIWLPERGVTVLHGRTLDEAAREALDDAEIVIVNYEILDAHLDALAAREPRAAIFDESHYCKQPRARRTKAALALAHRVHPEGLRLALTGTPVMNRPKELVSQLRLLGRLREFGSGARLSRRYSGPASHERLHWNLRAHCYVRRLKSEVLPQLPEKSHETVVIEIDNEQEYRLAERDVVAWLQSQPLDLRTLEARVSAAIRAERLARLNYLRQLAARGKLAASLRWIDDFAQSGEPLIVFADHIEVQRAVLERFPHAAHVLGSDNAADRDAAVQAFQEPGGPELIVCSLKAASHGITLTRASNVAFLELDWTPARLEQAEDRAHRIGQRNAVTAWYLLAPNTIDATLEGVLDAKRELIGAITDGRVEVDRTVLDSVVRGLRGDGEPSTEAA